MTPAPNVSITYCRLCGWLLRAAWMGQELLSTFADELGSVTLIPDETGGVFVVRIDGTAITVDEERFGGISARDVGGIEEHSLDTGGLGTGGADEQQPGDDGYSGTQRSRA